MIATQQETPEMIDRARVAYHEAGHVVVACYLGMSVVQSSIKPDGCESMGATAVMKWGRKIRPRVAVLQAGMLADHVGCELRGWDFDALAAGAGADYLEIETLLGRLSPRTRIAARQDAGIQAADILMDHWQCVEAVMRALYERETLNSLELLHIMHPAPPLPLLPDGAIPFPRATPAQYHGELH